MDTFYFHTEKLDVGYHGTPVVSDVCLYVKRGEILTLIGPNGAGKSTILKSVIAQLAPIAGTLYLDGSDLAGISPQKLAQRMSVVLTERIKTEWMTCEDVVATGRHPYTGTFGILSENDRRKVEEAMRLVNILELKDRDFSEISDGQKQRVMLARAICQEPEILVLDEPTSFLDIRYKLEFLSVLQKLCRERALTVIMSLHELDLAERVSDRVACVSSGRIDRFGTTREVFSGTYIPRVFELENGSYDARTGQLELKAADGAPRVFVIPGCGKGTYVFRRLQRQGIPFVAGFLWKNDLDYPAARALAAEVIAIAPFQPVSEDQMQHAKQLIDQCDYVIGAFCPDQNAGTDAERAILALYAYAGEKMKLMK